MAFMSGLVLSISCSISLYANAAYIPTNAAIMLAKAAKSGVNSAKQTVSPVCGAEFTLDVI